MTSAEKSSDVAASTGPHNHGIPESWRWIQLADVVVSMKNGIYKPSTSYADDGVACLRMYNIGDGKVVWRDIKRMHLSSDELAEYELLPGDLLVNRVNSRELVGKTAVIPSGIERCVFESKNIRVRVDQRAVTPDWVCYGLLLSGSKYFTRNAQQVVGMASISQPQVSRFPLPLPPVNEQRRIVAEIEKQFSRLDAAVATLKRVQANLKRYRASVLQAACEGRLVATEAELARAEGRDYEAADVLLTRTTAPPRPNRWNSRSTDVIRGHAALSVGNAGTKLPAGWTWSALVDIARMESGHTPSREHPEWWGGDVSWIGIADAREHDGQVINRTFQHTNEAGLANSAARLLPAGTVCVSRTASVGYVVVMGKPMATSQDFVNWTPTPAILSDWLRVVFSADKEALRGFGKGSVHKTIYFPEWLSMHVAVPPRAEQERIVAEVDRRLSIVEQLDLTISAQVKRAERLRQSVLQRAFEGRLVPQDAADESTHMLFERLRNHPIIISKLPARRTRQERPMKQTTVENVQQLTSRLAAEGGSLTPERLITVTGLTNNIDRFFELLREGRDNGSLNVPIGTFGVVSQNNAN